MKPPQPTADEQKLEPDLEDLMDKLSNYILDIIFKNPKKYLLKSKKERS